MKKQIVIMCMMLFSLSACQQTPEEAVVVDKSKGIAEESIIPVDDNTPKNLNVPKQWKEVIEMSMRLMSHIRSCGFLYGISNFTNSGVFRGVKKANEKKFLCSHNL